MRYISVIYLLLFVSLTGCSAKQGYISLRDWQRQQCETVNDRDQRERCLEDSTQRYEEYIDSDEYKQSDN